MSVIRALSLLVVLAAAPLAQADTLLIDGLDGSRQSASARPSRGMSMSNVEARYGAPSTRTGAIGDPPITRWEYPGFTVYFEYEHVIHAVQNR